MEAYGGRTVTVYEEKKVVRNNNSSVFGFCTNPVDESDPVGTLYLFGMGVCFASSYRLFSTNKKVTPTDIGYDYYRRLAHGGIKNVSYVLYKEGEGSVVVASGCKELEEDYDSGAYERLKEEEYVDDDWEREFSLNTWRERELKRCSVEWKIDKRDDDEAVEMIKRVVVEEEELARAREREKGKEKEKEEKAPVVYNINYNISNNVSNNVSNVSNRLKCRSDIKNSKENNVSEGTKAHRVVLLVVVFVLLVALGFSIFNVLA